MLSKSGQFDAKDASSLVENNLVVAASVALEESFNRYLTASLEFGEDWKTNAFRAGVAFCVYNVIKYASLCTRDEKGWTFTAKIARWVWKKLF